MLKTASFGLGFQHLPGDLVNVNAWKTMFDPYNKDPEHPADTQRRNNVVTTSLQRRDVAMMLQDVAVTL